MPATTPQSTATTAPAGPTQDNAPSYHPPGQPVIRDYVVGPLDVLSITSYNEPSLSGKFAVEADQTFTCPLRA